MENKVLHKNIDHIAGYDKELAYKILMADISKSNINVTQTIKNEYNIIYNNILIHDNLGAEDEAQRIVANLEDSRGTIKIVYGLGLGYLADSMATKIKQGKIIVYEPNLDLMHFVFSIAQIDAVLKNNVFICNDETSLIKHISKLANFDSKMSISFLSSHKKAYNDDILRVYSIAQKTLGELVANKNTFAQKGPRAVINSVSNLKYIINNPDISALKDIYKDSTALCLSAGPSLAENIELVKNNQDKFVIFAVNNTLKLLKENNIKPDFVVDIEAIDNSKQFSKEVSETYFILEAFCNPNVAKLKNKKTFNYISTSNFLNPWLLDTLKIKSNLKTFGTVSYTALESAHLMGFRRIILLGSDLAYKNGKLYAKGSQYEELECVFDKEINKYVIKPRNWNNYVQALRLPEFSEKRTMDGAKNFLEYLNRNIDTIKAQDGSLLPTQSGYSIFIEYFKNAALAYKKQDSLIDLINSSTGGAQIDGFKNIPLSEVVEGLSPVKKINLDNFEPQYDLSYVKNKISPMLSAAKEFNNTVLEAIAVGDKLNQELEIKKTFTHNAVKLAKKHKELLTKVIKFKDNKHLKDIAFVFIYTLVELLQKDYLEGVETTKLTIKNLRTKLNYIKYAFNIMIKELTYCETFILE